MDGLARLRAETALPAWETRALRLGCGGARRRRALVRSAAARMPALVMVVIVLGEAEARDREYDHRRSRE